eukprot:TRINITY_DN24652_c3_g1_i1.p1 TRINITY_DN24652_c3_g1~~TRINITY_DN24652_c3_g1_i1.p1  ORF type:complete len:110 (+),score=16.25 TRINITY_DN24652_c3_g1_i1:433-762(+)
MRQLSLQFLSLDNFLDGSPPSSSLCKLNFDGSVTGNPGHTNIRGIIRDSERVSMLMFSGLGGICWVNQAEIKVLKMGLEEACCLHIMGYQVEGDSLYAIRWAKDSYRVP